MICSQNYLHPFLENEEYQRAGFDNPAQQKFRETSSISGFQKLTVCHALQALCRAQILRRAPVEDSSNLFSFVDYSRFDTLTINCRNSVSNLEYAKLPKTHAEKDLFGVGHLYTVWQHLVVSPERNAYQTAKALNLSASTVYSAFQKLQDMTLITYSNAEGMFYGEMRTDTALQMLALEFGRHGRSKAREEKYQDERQRFLNREFEKAKERYARQMQELKDQR